MKTIQQIELDIKNIETEIKENLQDYKPAKIKRLKAEIEIKRDCIKYLEHNPTSEFLQKEAERLNKLILGMNDLKRYEQWCNDNMLGINPKSRAKYMSQLDIKKYRKQLEVINYLLK